MTINELPLGFSMALAQNEPAMRAFSALSPEQKEAVLQKTRRVRSKSEMQRLVSGLADPSFSVAD